MTARIVVALTFILLAPFAAAQERGLLAEIHAQEEAEMAALIAQEAVEAAAFEASARVNEDRVIAGDLPGLLSDGVNVSELCLVMRFNLRGERLDGRLREYSPEEAAGIVRTCSLHDRLLALEAEAARARALEAQRQADIRAAEAAQAREKAMAAEGWVPVTPETEREMYRSRPYGGYGYGGYYGDDALYLLERQERERARDEARREAEEYRREERREAQRQLEAARQTRDAIEAETARRRGTPPPSRLEGYYGLDK